MEDQQAQKVIDHDYSLCGEEIFDNLTHHLTCLHVAGIVGSSDHGEQSAFDTHDDGTD